MKRLALLFFCVTLAACGASATTTPRIRVARDLGCTAEQTNVERLSEHRWQVNGCGRTAVYVCTYPVRECWREGDIYNVEAGETQAER